MEASFDDMNQDKKHTHSKKFFQSSCQKFLKMCMSYDIIKPHSLTTEDCYQNMIEYLK